MIETLLIWLAEPVVAGLVKWTIGAAVTYFVAKPLVENFGSTPANKLADLGIPKSQQYEDAKKFKADKKKFLDELNAEKKQEIEELYKKVDKLEDDKTKVASQLANAQTEEDKNRFISLIKEIDKEVKETKTLITQKEREVKENNQEIVNTFDPIGNPNKITEEQFTTNANTPNLNSWLNWGIIGIGVITAVLTVRLIFGTFKKWGKEIG